MANIENPNGRKHVSGGSDLRDAKPLLQAIFLGMVLAVALVAAATMANSEADENGALQDTEIEQSLPDGKVRQDPHGR
ncbi:MAG: hypothetical protein RIE06_12685 [Roseibium album]|uniref:hypothetical protein n=1 Tax=Roseibium album TaxID=311410 RepID=UPI000CF1B3BA|nr:hypothetical protein [Roseibium album]MBG6146435.1 hypothetical protein [Labrenzia sp. EL_142]MBG6173410.1 hypothetical protein [Labrenzia sp. EL_132]MBG6227820.1 hypothetical protein [Labrenzia sp. EL_208]